VSEPGPAYHSTVQERNPIPGCGLCSTKEREREGGGKSVDLGSSRMIKKKIKKAQKNVLNALQTFRLLSNKVVTKLRATKQRLLSELNPRHPKD